MSSTESNSQLVSVLLPATVVRRELPVNFEQKDAELFHHDLERTIPQIELLRFTDVLITSNGLLLKNWRILPESFAFPTELSQWKIRSTVKLLVTNYLFRRRRFTAGEILFITDYWSTAYFHWITDTLARLFVVPDQLNHAVLALPSTCESHEFVRASLKALAVPFVAIKPDEVLECRTLLLPTHTAPPGHFNPGV